MYLTFWPMKNISRKKPRVWLWFVYKVQCSFRMLVDYARLQLFAWVHSDSKEVSYFSSQSKYPNLKNSCHIKPKFFLWAKLLENLFLTKYLISVTATLSLKNLKYTLRFLSDDVFHQNSWVSLKWILTLYKKWSFPLLILVTFTQEISNEKLHFLCSVACISTIRNFAKFTGKHLCRSLFFSKITGLRLFELCKRCN